MKWQASLEVDDDLIEGRDYIRGDNDIAARAFLNTAFETFDLLGDFPEMGPRARLRSKKLRDLRFFVMPRLSTGGSCSIASLTPASGLCGCCTAA